MEQKHSKTNAVAERIGRPPGLLAKSIAEASAEVIGEASMKQAVIYLRVSSKMQLETDFDAEGFSLPAQRQACIRKAAAMGAQVVDEFKEEGESGTTTKRRKALAALLERVRQGGIDYVIVHKVDRLARSRADDVAIAEEIRGSGATLVSVSENIDETPSGMLLHGIMASIAEFYSRNLANETLKGTMEKAKRGGTPGKAPIGYLNVREKVDGREIKTVAIDPERAPLVRYAFKLYATGNYALSELAPILAARGLRTRATPRKPAKELGTNDLQFMLRNDYYIGVVRYRGLVVEGRHEKLIDDETFQAVQDLLTAKRQSGEKPWRHLHYLRGSIYCGDCGGRLIYTRANGRGGVYEYFVCGGRAKGVCNQPHHRVAAVEDAVERSYRTIGLGPETTEQIEAAMRAYVDTLVSRSDPARVDARSELQRLAAEEKKLLRAHYDDRISETVFNEEQERIRRERIAAERRLQELDVDHDEVLEKLDLALRLVADLGEAYQRADGNARRMFNQAIFEHIWIDIEGVDRVDLASPFREMADLKKDGTPGGAFASEGSNIASMEPSIGLEPMTPSLPWCPWWSNLPFFLGVLVGSVRLSQVIFA